MSNGKTAYTSDLGPLADGSRVIILGGGPGGSGCALAIHHLAAELGRNIRISIIENKDFAGERQYNQCVGVLSPPLSTLFDEHLGVKFPHHLSQNKIEGYILHTGREQIALRDTGEASVSLRRILFDGFMLQTAREKGIEVIQARASDIEIYPDHVVVYTDSAPVRGDVLVGAWGMDGGTTHFFSKTTGYSPPASLNTIVTKFHPGEAGMDQFGTFIHAYLPRDTRIEFGGITPKRDHLTINIAGKSVNEGTMDAFLSMPNVRSVLPVLPPTEPNYPGDLRYYKGRFPCSLAKRFYGDRYVIVGDASGMLRAFKGKGVTSAIQTGIRAAQVIMRFGISESAFHEHYLAANQDIIRDFPYGRGMRFLTIFLSHYELLDPVLRAAQQNSDLQFALMGAVSAHDPYRQVLGRVLSVHSALAILKEFFSGPSHLQVQTP